MYFPVLDITITLERYLLDIYPVYFLVHPTQRACVMSGVLPGPVFLIFDCEVSVEAVYFPDLNGALPGPR